MLGLLILIDIHRIGYFDAIIVPQISAGEKSLAEAYALKKWYILGMLAAIVAAAAISANDLQAQLDRALQAFQQARPQIERNLGASQAQDLEIRLGSDRDDLKIALPDGYTRADWDETVRTLVAIDTQAITDAAAGTLVPLSIDQIGLHERFVRSQTDGKWLPIAVYIPPRASPTAPLAVVLHGHPQTETEILSQPFLRRLADRTGTILIAPWGRGAYDFQGPAQRDVYDALHAAQAALHTDPRRTYLVGYSMGGFTVFKIGPSYPNWSAVMDISGAMLNSEVATIRFAWRDTPVYVVTGKHDASIPSIYGEETAAYLTSLGVPTGFYEEPDGEHQVRTLIPALTRAWLDMHAQVVHSDLPAERTRPNPILPNIQMNPQKP
jgi:acetyl esterase/lipase